MNYVDYSIIVISSIIALFCLFMGVKERVDIKNNLQNNQPSVSYLESELKNCFFELDQKQYEIEGLQWTVDTLQNELRSR
jgi:peptidoglycan hydrolase CwlO-like protein